MQIDDVSGLTHLSKASWSDELNRPLWVVGFKAVVDADCINDVGEAYQNVASGPKEI